MEDVRKEAIVEGDVKIKEADNAEEVKNANDDWKPRELEILLASFEEDEVQQACFIRI
jgi:hypothetical protein